MTTYTISKDQLKALIEGCESGDVLKYVPALSLLRHLQPNTQEPAFWLNELGQLSATRGFAERNSPGSKLIPLYAHPAPQANTQEPLTDEQLRGLFTATNTAEPLAEGWPGLDRFARAVEQAHNIGVKT